MEGRGALQQEAKRERKGWKEGDREELAVGSVEGPGSTRPGVVNRYFRNDNTQSMSCTGCAQNKLHISGGQFTLQVRVFELEYLL